jgi:hypothetical protein
VEINSALFTQNEELLVNKPIVFNTRPLSINSPWIIPTYAEFADEKFRHLMIMILATFAGLSKVGVGLLGIRHV